MTHENLSSTSTRQTGESPWRVSLKLLTCQPTSSYKEVEWEGLSTTCCKIDVSRPSTGRADSSQSASHPAPPILPLCLPQSHRKADFPLTTLPLTFISYSIHVHCPQTGERTFHILEAKQNTNVSSTMKPSMERLSTKKRSMQCALFNKL